MAKKLHLHTTDLNREPTFKEWHALVEFVMGKGPEVELTLVLLLCTAELATAREAVTTDETVRERLRQVRAAVERERELEQYAGWRNEQMRKNPEL